MTLDDGQSNAPPRRARTSGTPNRSSHRGEEERLGEREKRKTIPRTHERSGRRTGYPLSIMHAAGIVENERGLGKAGKREKQPEPIRPTPRRDQGRQSAGTCTPPSAAVWQPFPRPGPTASAAPGKSTPGHTPRPGHIRILGKPSRQVNRCMCLKRDPAGVGEGPVPSRVHRHESRTEFGGWFPR